VDGYRLSAIRRGTLFDKLGIKNGDIVHTVNGQSLSSTSDAMNAYQGLQNESSFSFEITRRNKKKTLNYQVR
jgi:general secretion pathway protein C